MTAREFRNRLIMILDNVYPDVRMDERALIPAIKIVENGETFVLTIVKTDG